MKGFFFLPHNFSLLKWLDNLRSCDILVPSYGNLCVSVCLSFCLSVHVSVFLLFT